VRVLLDTNILISREASKPLPNNLLELLQLLSDSEVRVVIHPRSVDDLDRDDDKVRRDTNISKIRSYTLLESPPSPFEDQEFLQLIGETRSPNDSVDFWILYAAYRNAVSYLITEDKGMIRRAGRIGIKTKVISVDEARKLFAKSEPRSLLQFIPALSTVPVYSLRLEDPFFDGLKKDYHPDFERWFKRIAEEGRMAIVYYNEDHSLGALLILKPENEGVACDPPIPPERRLKIATMKVEHQGFKIGELFIKLAVQRAIQENCPELYLTHFVKEHDELVNLISEYGFIKVAAKSNGEAVFLKELRPDTRARNLPPNNTNAVYYPTYYDGRRVKKFIVPILPEFHQDLFVDYGDRQVTMSEYTGGFVVEGNAIKKAYLTNSKTKELSPGDVLLFYRSHDLKGITAVGTVESVHYNVKSKEQVATLVEKRTVFSISEIEEIMKKQTTVIMFKWHFYFPNPVSLSSLSRLNISAPQTIARVSHSDYVKIRELGGIDERFTVS
jgi:predicted nucleic acid-binding protein